MKKELNIALCYSNIFENYSAALTEAGHALGMEVHPVWFDCGKKIPGMLDFSRFRIEDFDALLLPGGGDLDPSFYGEEIRGSINPDINTDRCQFALADAFVKAEKPILGICRGHQLLNVYFGGSLCQDIPAKRNHMRLDAETDNRHMIHAEKDSWLYELYGDNFAVNSSHHQAVKRPGKGMKIVAVCEDGTVEAMEHETLPILTVQFHPERMDYRHRREDTVAGGRVFEKFLNMTQIGF